MIETLAVANYRSLLKLTTPLAQLTVITGENGAGKSNLYRALRLLSDTAQGKLVQSLAQEGGLQSTFWAGPEKLTRDMKSGVHPVQGTVRHKPVCLKLGFASAEFGFAVDLGLPKPSQSRFSRDPEIKREVIWAGPAYRPASALVDRRGPVVKIRAGRKWDILQQHVNGFDSLFDQLADPDRAPEIFRMREIIRNWRFYDQFRTDRDSPIRLAQVGTRTPVLSHDGSDLAAALQTILEIGDAQALKLAIDDAFPGALLNIEVAADNRFKLQFQQPGLLRPLDTAELSDGTLRYLLWIAALLTPRPPTLMVLNEPENSLHTDLLPALARLIVNASKHSQLWIVSHARRLIAALEEHPECRTLELTKELGQTLINGQRPLDEPAWHWPSR